MLAGRLRRPRPRSRRCPCASCAALWTLPTNLLGHLAGLLASGRLPRRVGGPAAVGWLYPIRAGLGPRLGRRGDARPRDPPPPRHARRADDWTRASRWRTSWPTRASTIGSARSICRCTSCRRRRARSSRAASRSTSAACTICNLLEQTFIAVPSSAPRAPQASDAEVSRGARRVRRLAPSTGAAARIRPAATPTAGPMRNHGVGEGTFRGARRASRRRPCTWAPRRARRRLLLEAPARPGVGVLHEGPRRAPPPERVEIEHVDDRACPGRSGASAQPLLTRRTSRSPLRTR